jgi:hypothetical protein
VHRRDRLRAPGLSDLALVAALLAATGSTAAPLPQTPLERQAFQRISSSAEISRFLAALDAGSERARVELLGHSAGGRPIEALHVSSGPAARGLTILLVGTQHGTEPSGGEALLMAARDLVSGPLRPILDQAELIVVPNANPDGRDRHRRVNGMGINLSTDFVTLSQPESRALNALVMRERPEVVLDVHESAILKKRSLGRQGYVTDFEAQFEIANNPNIAPAIRDLSLSVLLPEIIAAVAARGLPARRYIGEITSIHQPITNGGLSLRNLRNKAGMAGSVSFLVENRLDPPGRDYPSFRNIKGRTTKQLLSIEAFLDTILAHRSAVLAAVRSGDRERCVLLEVAYGLDTAHPRITLPLRRRADEVLEARPFADHRAVETGAGVSPARAYAITGHRHRMRTLLERHGLAYRTLARPQAAKAQALGSTGPAPEAHIEADIRVAPLDLWVDLDPRDGPLLTLLLEPRSTTAVFQQPEYQALLRPGEPPFLYRIGGTSCATPPR